MCFILNPQKHNCFVWKSLLLQGEQWKLLVGNDCLFRNLASFVQHSDYSSSFQWFRSGKSYFWVLSKLMLSHCDTMIVSLCRIQTMYICSTHISHTHIEFVTFSEFLESNSIINKINIFSLQKNILSFLPFLLTFSRFNQLLSMIGFSFVCQNKTWLSLYQI